MALSDLSLDEQISSQTLFDTIPICKMFVAKYGRPLVVARVQQIVRSFDEKAIGTIYLSIRADGNYAILDGQHRIAAANLKGLTTLSSRVFIDLTYEQEAALYVKFATVNKQTSLDRFKARVEAREPLALDILDILNSTNLTISYSGQSAGTLQAVSTLEAIYKKGGRAHLRNVLTTIYHSWKDQPRAYVLPILYGISMFLQRYNNDNTQPKLDWTRLYSKLHQLTPEILIAKSSQLKGVISQAESQAVVGMVILYEYNSGLHKQNKLPEWTRNG